MVATCRRCHSSFSTQESTDRTCPVCASSAAEPPPTLGKYRILSRLGKGAMGEVFRAVHPKLGTTVAIKVLREVAQKGSEREALVQRFIREAQIGARLRHPGIVHVHDIDEEEGRLFMVMDYVQGVSLEEEIRKRRLALGRSLGIAREVADALHVAHQQGVVHRDLKPANILIDVKGRAHLLDFGLSHLKEEPLKLTRTGTLLGTVQYMAPEQILGAPRELDGRTDVYALGMILYEMLTGRSPVAGSSFYQTLKNIELVLPPPPSRIRPGIPAQVDALVMRATAKKKEERFSTAEEMARELASLSPRGKSAGVRFPLRGPRGKRLLLAAGAASLLIAAAIAIPWKRSPEVPRSKDLTGVLDRIRNALERNPRSESETERRRVALWGGVKSLADVSDPVALYWRGKARVHVGDLRGAFGDWNEAARRGYEPAIRERVIPWIYYRFLIAGSPQIPWLSIASPGEVKDLIQGLSVDDPLFAGCAALVRRDFRRAREIFAGAPQSSPDWYVLKALAFLDEDGNVAREAVREGLRRDCGYAPLTFLGLLIAFPTSEEEAWVRRCLNAAAASRTPEVHLVLARQSFQEGKENSAREHLRRAAKAGAESRALLWEIGMTLYARGMFGDGRGLPPADAASLLRRLEKLDPARHPAAGIARLLLNLARGNEEEVRRLVLALPDDPSLGAYAEWKSAVRNELLERHYFRGDALVYIGDPQRAKQAFETFLAAPVKDRSEDWRRCASQAHQGLAAVEFCLGSLSDAATEGRIREHLLAAARLFVSTSERFYDWIRSARNDESRRTVLRRILLEAARVAVRENRHEAAIDFLHFAVLTGVRLTELAKEKTWAPLRTHRRYKQLAGLKEN